MTLGSDMPVIYHRVRWNLHPRKLPAGCPFRYHSFVVLIDTRGATTR